MPASLQELPVLRDLPVESSRVDQCGECATAPPLPTSVHRRFDRAARLLGESTLLQLARSTVYVFGAGGVGSFCAEGLVRSGVGTVRLVDFDRVCVTNVNRQLHAMKGTLGKSKVQVMAERLRAINPDARIDAVEQFYEEATADALLAPRPDLVVDAIDNMKAKLHLLVTCKARGIPVVSSMGAAARVDPTKVRIGDLRDTRNDPFAAELRKHLRKKHGYDMTRATGITAVWSEERPTAPQSVSYDDDGFRCVCPHGQNEHHSCDHRNRIEGSVGYVTSVFGMVAASAAVEALRSRP